MDASTLAIERPVPRIPLTAATRSLLWLIVAVIVPLGVVLYFFPGRTDRLWMWTASDPRSAMLIGALYLGATLYYLIALREDDWLQTQGGLEGVFIIAVVLLMAVMWHWPEIRPYHPTTLLWLAAYYAPLFLVPITWRLQMERLGRPVADGVTLSPKWRTWLVARSGFYLLVAVSGFLFAAPISALWPWPMSPLEVRMFVGQPATFVAVGAVILSGNQLWRRQRVGLLYGASLGLLQLVALVVAPSPYDWSAPLALVLPLLFAEWVLTALLAFLRYER